MYLHFVGIDIAAATFTVAWLVKGVWHHATFEQRRTDYGRFAQMLVNSGELDGARLLSRKTVDLMMQNHLAGLAKPNIGGDEASGFGLGGCEAYPDVFGIFPVEASHVPL